MGGDATLFDAPVRVPDRHLLLKEQLKLAALAALAVVAAGWLAYSVAWRTADPHPLAFRDLTAELQAAPAQSFVRRIRTREQLAHVIRLHGSPPAPPIDFSRDEALLITAGPRSSTGHALHVVHAVEERGRVEIVVREQTPSLRQPGRARITYPYRLLVFHRVNKPIDVRWEGRP